MLYTSENQKWSRNDFRTGLSGCLLYKRFTIGIDVTIWLKTHAKSLTKRVLWTRVRRGMASIMPGVQDVADDTSVIRAPKGLRSRCRVEKPCKC